MTHKRRTEWSWRSGGAALPVVAALVLAGSANGQCLPRIFGSVDTPGIAVGVAVSGDVAYVADFDSGLQVIDVSDPGNPVILGSVDTTDRARGVAVSGAVAYVADELSGLQVIDVSSCGRRACCINDGCLDLTVADCDSVSGTSLGFGTNCATEKCPPPCVSDVDGDGEVDFDDLVRVLSAWGPCPE